MVNTPRVFTKNRQKRKNSLSNLTYRFGLNFYMALQNDKL